MPSQGRQNGSGKNPKKSKQKGRADADQDVELEQLLASSRGGWRNISPAFLALAILFGLIAVGLGHLHMTKGLNPNSFASRFGASSSSARTSLDPPDEQMKIFLYLACHIGECHKDLILSGRSFIANATLPIGETLVRVPRKMQIWDLDALRDPFVRDQLFRASHKKTGNSLGSEAFLAAYIAIQTTMLRSSPKRLDPLRRAYLEILPTYDDFSDDHPILWSDAELVDNLGIRSSAYNVVKSYQSMIQSEYEAFSDISFEFAAMIRQEDYYTARLNVLTRSFSVGAPGPDEAVRPSTSLGSELEGLDPLNDELQAYQDLLGIDFNTHGCRAMVPILDMFNHYPSRHADYSYDSSNHKQREFVVEVTARQVDFGNEPLVSYAAENIPDSHLFARYGFVVGDGSGLSEAALSFYHEVLNPTPLAPQFSFLPYSGTTTKIKNMQTMQLIKYLSYDDGYEYCIPGPDTHPVQAELKKLKLRHLLSIANDPDRWIAQLPPRKSNGSPKVSGKRLTMEAPYFKREELIDTYYLDRIQSTCRLISLIDSDLDGKAVQILKDNLENPSFIIDRGNDSLEFRSMMCIARLAGVGLLNQEVQVSIEDVFDRVGQLTRSEYGSKKWKAFQVRLGEMQALQALRNLMLERVNEKWEDKKHQATSEYTLRDDKCPEEYSRYLHP